MQKLSLYVIGFHYHFESLNIQKDESTLSKAFAALRGQGSTSRALIILQFIFPPFRAIVGRFGFLFRLVTKAFVRSGLKRTQE